MKSQQEMIPDAVQEARLIKASPDEVFRVMAARLADDVVRNERLETSLLARQDPLINLALAYTARDRKVVSHLYKTASTGGETGLEERFNTGVRVACLANPVVARWSIYDFPVSIIGEAELARIIQVSDQPDIIALLQNPCVSTTLLEQLFKKTGPFEPLNNVRWNHLVQYASRNPRINDEQDSDDMPDLGHYGVHKAIFGLCGTAPVEAMWAYALVDLLGGLNPGQVASVERPELERVLARWRTLAQQVDENEHAAKAAAELRILIGALYGSKLATDKKGLAACLASTDEAMRAIHYANAELTEKKVDDLWFKDRRAFWRGAMRNAALVRNPARRAQIASGLDEFQIRRLNSWQGMQPYGEETLAEGGQAEGAFKRLESELAGMRATLQAMKINVIQTLVAIAFGAMLVWTWRH